MQTLLQGKGLEGVGQQLLPSSAALSAATADRTSQCGTVQPIQWKNYHWDPARLDAWLHDEADKDSSSSSESAGAPDASTHCVQPQQEQQQEPQAGEASQQLVPQHLRQLLLLLLQGAADTGKGQDLIWTPQRLAGWLADNVPEPSRSSSPSSFSTAVPPTSVLSSLVQLLPLVSGVAARRALAAYGGGAASPTSDGQQGPQPSSSSQWTLSCAGHAQAQLASDELTSPAVRQQQYQALDMQPNDDDQQQLRAGQGSVQPACSRMVGLQAVGQQDSLPQPNGLQQADQQLLLQGPAPAMHHQQQAQLLGAAAAGQEAADTAGQAAAGSSSLWLPRKVALPGDYPVVEDNAAWSPAAFDSCAAAAAASLGLPQASSSSGAGTAAAGTRSSAASGPTSASAHCTLDSSSSATQAPRFGVLMLVHEKGVTAAEAWEAWEGAQGGKAVVRVHLKAGVSTGGLPGEAWVSSRQLPSRVCSQWGCISLTAAILQAAADMLQQHPQLQHVALVSGQDLPVAPVPRDLRPGLSLFGRFQFGQAFDDAARQVAAEVLAQQLGLSKAESKAWGDALTFHHTWMVLDRQLLLALLSKQEELLRVGTVLNERFMQPDVAVAADEFILITAAMRYGFVKQVVHRKLHTYMSALRRQHRQQAPAAAGQPHQPTPEPGEDQARPAKQQRLTTQPPSDDEPAAAAAAGGKPGSSVSRPGSSGSSRDSSLTRASAASTAGPRRHTDDSSGGSSPQQGGRGRRSRREQAGDAAAAIDPEDLVGRSIKVWWELDQAFYRGTVTYYSLSTRRHTVKYEDGDVEIINLAKESWKLEGPPPAQAKAPGPQHTSSAGSAGSALQEGTFGVLLDCCPTLALFHPTETRHPHSWRNFSECLLVDVNSHRQGNNRLTLLDALGLVGPNSALFFRKVAAMQRQGPAQLMGCLKLLWKGRPLPVMIEELQLE